MTYSNSLQKKKKEDYSRRYFHLRSSLSNIFFLPSLFSGCEEGERLSSDARACARIASSPQRIVAISAFLTSRKALCGSWIFACCRFFATHHPKKSGSTALEKWLASSGKFSIPYIREILISLYAKREDDGDIMEVREAEPTAAENLQGADRADHFFNQRLQTARTLGEVRAGMATVLAEVASDVEAERRAGDLQRVVDQVAQGNENVRLEHDLGPGVLGVNWQIGTRNTAMRRDQLEAEVLVENPDRAWDTVLHENGSPGHATQDAHARVAVVDERGEFHEETVALEGNVVESVASEIGKKRPDLPQKVYKEGAELVRRIGNSVVDTYTRIGGANVGKPLQLEFWKRQPNITLEDMLQQGARVGMSKVEICTYAQELGHLEGVNAEHALAA